LKKYISLVLGLIATTLLGMGLWRLVTSGMEWNSLSFLLVFLLSIGTLLTLIASVLSLTNPSLASVLFIVSISFIALHTLITLYLLLSADIIITRTLSSIFLILAAAYNANPDIFKKSRQARG
jgi:hypothetical protein